MTKTKAAPAKKPAAKKPASKPAAAPATKRQRTDKEAVERDYRTGRFTLRELGAKHKCDHALIARWIKRHGWTQDLTAAVKSATNALVIQESVNKAVTEGQQTVTNTVLAAAELNAQVILGHRNRVQRATEVAMRMLDELDQTTLGADKLQSMFETLTAELSGPALASVQMQFRDLMRLHNRVTSAQKLMAALGEAQKLEAQTFNLYADKKPGGSDLEQMTDDEIDAAIAEKQARLSGQQ